VQRLLLRALFPWIAAVLAIGSSAVADGGAAELSLDAGAVRALVATRLPDPVRLSPGGLGDLTLRVLPPVRVEFRDGGIDVPLRLTAVEIGWSASLAVRLMPEVVPTTGALRLAVTEARVDLPFDYDITAWLRPLDLPRRFEWTVPVADGQTLELLCFLQGLRVEDERLVVELGVHL
jgi:hypothetical protein